MGKINAKEKNLRWGSYSTNALILPTNEFYICWRKDKVVWRVKQSSRGGKAFEIELRD